MYRDHAHEEYQSICAIADETFAQRFARLMGWGSQELQRTARLRQILLYQTSGLCPPNLLVSPETGSLLSRKELCQNEARAQAQSSRLRGVLHNMDKLPIKALLTSSKNDMVAHASLLASIGIFTAGLLTMGGNDYARVAAKIEKYATQNEARFLASPSYKCSLSVAQHDALKTMMQHSRGSCKAFRRYLLNSTQIQTVAIHFFRWDGTPRQSVGEIEKAVCMYPASSRKMKAVLAAFLALFAGGAMVKKWLDSAEAEQPLPQPAVTKSPRTKPIRKKSARRRRRRPPPSKLA